MLFNSLVEGDTDEAVPRRIIGECGHAVGTCYGKRGIGYISSKISGFNLAAKGLPILCLVDFMDTRMACPPEVVGNWLPHRERNMIFRVVVRAIESWLIADRVNMAEFLYVHPSRVPEHPEDLPNPKRALVDLARSSRKSSIREALVPAQNTGAVVGRLYPSEMIRFTNEHWNPRNARLVSPSLASCMSRLESMTQ
ncbi:MAG: hypothetical protein ACYDC8_00150 [Gammaproteobacteria bacterium]